MQKTSENVHIPCISFPSFLCAALPNSGKEFQALLVDVTDIYGTYYHLVRSVLTYLQELC
jgi:hypothetical protein